MTTLPPMFDRLRTLDGHLRRNIRGQERVIPEVVQRVKIGESGLASTGRPKGSFLLIGPTGVGKTELTKTLSEVLYGRPDPLRLDMSEFSATDAIRLFIGDESGALGRLGEQLVANPLGGVLLADEIEKANPKVMDVFLQILDAGRVTCGKGRLFDLSNFYVCMTSNLGAADILRSKHLNFTQIERNILAEVARHFRPEFLGRINHSLVFNKLTYDVQVDIAKLNLSREIAFLEHRGHSIRLAEDVLSFLITKGFDKYLGARPLRDAIEKHVRAPIADFLVTHGAPAAAGLLTVHPSKAHLVFTPDGE